MAFIVRSNVLPTSCSQPKPVCRLRIWNEFVQCSGLGFAMVLLPWYFCYLFQWFAFPWDMRSEFSLVNGFFARIVSLGCKTKKSSISYLGLCTESWSHSGAVISIRHCVLWYYMLWSYSQVVAIRKYNEIQTFACTSNPARKLVDAIHHSYSPNYNLSIDFA